MTIGLPDSKFSYPAEQALYQVSVRRNKCLPSASFRSHLAVDTLAFGFEIPVITALSGLAPFRIKTCPAHLRFSHFVALCINKFPFWQEVWLDTQ
jgi:hypothetical protein